MLALAVQVEHTLFRESAQHLPHAGQRATESGFDVMTREMRFEQHEPVTTPLPGAPREIAERTARQLSGLEVVGTEVEPTGDG